MGLPGNLSRECIHQQRIHDAHQSRDHRGARPSQGDEGLGQDRGWSLEPAQFLVLTLVVGLDMRFGWTRELGAAWHVAGAVVFAVGLGLFGWAMITNAYFSTAVRIQVDRGQTVCRNGPYRFVRHPGYAGALLQSLGIPFLLGSLWALIPGITAAALMIIRTSLEDRMLQAELPGYRDFVQEVHYHLIPGIW